jgi:EAL domain-containing protein (putative c-di-GMP-specific phosphodiesterase class I)
LKIDRSFLEDFDTDPRAAAIVEAVISMSSALAVNVVTEGIEAEVQLERICRLGCHRAKGYYFCRPLAADAMTDWLAARL